MNYFKYIFDKLFENKFYHGHVSVSNPHYFCDKCGKDLWDKHKRRMNPNKAPDINITENGKKLCNKCFYINEEYDYRISHTAPSPEGNNSLDNLSDIYPDDIYSFNGIEYYGGYDKTMAKKSIQIIQKARNKPNYKVIIFRAVPENVNEINPGDWVSINKDYAIEHGKRYIKGKLKVLQKIVKAKELFTEGNSIHEWGYHP